MVVVELSAAYMQALSVGQSAAELKRRSLRAELHRLIHESSIVIARDRLRLLNVVGQGLACRLLSVLSVRIALVDSTVNRLYFSCKTAVSITWVSIVNSGTNRQSAIGAQLLALLTIYIHTTMCRDRQTDRPKEKQYNQYSS